MDVKVLGLNLDQLRFPDLRTISETRICAGFGVPPVLVGAKAGLDRSTFANYAEARRSFWEETIMPDQRLIGDVIVRLLPEVNDSTFVVPRRVTQGGAVQLEAEHDGTACPARPAGRRLLVHGRFRSRAFGCGVGFSSCGAVARSGRATGRAGR
ncbi:phage portal protein [Streptomyces ureilyticus]|uniref:phage portal protein n=1 Tax=Streptomyces ureilyticus TaxID=1775131 RepID=UPI0019D0770D|nr:phage portal protein [Streptomyces ureilyticus]